MTFSVHFQTKLGTWQRILQWSTDCRTFHHWLMTGNLLIKKWKTHTVRFRTNKLFLPSLPPLRNWKINWSLLTPKLSQTWEKLTCPRVTHHKRPPLKTNLLPTTNKASYPLKTSKPSTLNGLKRSILPSKVELDAWEEGLLHQSRKATQSTRSLYQIKI
jgi:hypothetical protein